MKIERILFATKFRELSYNALKALAPLKEAGLKEIVLANVIERDEVGFVPFGGYLKDEEERLTEEARIRFADWKAELEGEGISAKIEIRVGTPVHEMLKIADEEAVDLLVIGRKKRSGLGWLKGSKTAEIVRRSERPVMVYKYMVEFVREGEDVTRVNDRIFERPLLCANWSDESGRALSLLAGLGGLVKEALLCHVIETEYSGDFKPEEIQAEEGVCHMKLKDAAKGLESSGIKTECHISAGNIEDEIMRVARENGATMIIMGTTHKRKLEELWEGSPSHFIAGHSELPVVLVS